MEEYSIQQQQGAMIVKLPLELDHHLARQIRTEVDHLIDQGNIKNLLFDFGDSNFMDSSGIGMIMGRYKKLKFFGGKVAVTNISPAVDRIFSMSGLYQLVPKYESIEYALERLNAGQM